MSADENRDNVPSLLIAEQCVSAVNEYLDGLPEEERIKNEQHLCTALFNKWSANDQLHFMKTLLDKMNVDQYDEIIDHLELLHKRDFISLLAKSGMDHVAKIIMLHLDADSLQSSELVCKEWHRVICDEMIWKKFTECKIRSDSLWKRLANQQDDVQQLSKPEPGKVHTFYRALYLRVLDDIKRIDQNWRNGHCRITQINCNSDHSRGVYCVQYDENKIVSGLRDNTIKIWDRNSLRCIKTLTGHTGSVLCLQFDENVIISGSSDSTIRIWDLNTGEMRNTYIYHNEAVLHLKFEKGMLVTCSKDSKIVVWDITSTYEIVLRRILMGHRAAVNVIDFDEKYIISASGDRTIKVWNSSDAEFVRTLVGHDRGIACLQYRDELVVSGSSDKTIRLWNVESGDCLRVLKGHEDLVRCLRFDSKRIVSGAYDGKIKIWDLVAALDPRSPPSALCLQTLEEHDGKLFRLQFDEIQIVSSSHDDTILIWDFLNYNPNQ